MIFGRPETHPSEKDPNINLFELMRFAEKDQNGPNPRGQVSHSNISTAPSMGSGLTFHHPVRSSAAKRLEREAWIPLINRDESRIV